MLPFVNIHLFDPIGGNVRILLKRFLEIEEMHRLNKKNRTYSNYFPIATSDNFEFRLKINFV